MLRNYYINREWIVSQSARSVYRLSATLSVMLFVVLITLRIVGQIPPNAIPILRALLLSGVVGAALTMVAMEYFLFGFDNSSSLKKAIWFCILLLPPLGPALYCFVVYSRVVGKSSESLP
jgi:hypothetical protein